MSGKQTEGDARGAHPGVTWAARDVTEFVVLVEKLRELGRFSRKVMDLLAVEQTEGKPPAERKTAKDWKHTRVPSYVDRVDRNVRGPHPGEESPERALGEVLVPGEESHRLHLPGVHRETAGDLGLKDNEEETRVASGRKGNLCEHRSELASAVAIRAYGERRSSTPRGSSGWRPRDVRA